MKKLISIILICTLLTANLLLCVHGENVKTNEISYGIEVIKSKTQLKKNGVKGSAVEFDEEDFTSTFGIRSYSHIRIDKLPDVTAGVLKIGGVDVIEGQTISKENIGYLKFIPQSAAIETAKFTFSDSRGLSSRCLECVISYSENENNVPVSKNDEFRTYKNVSVFGRLEGYDEDSDKLSYVITSSPGNGFITVKDDGSFVYRPLSAYTGKDGFEYVVYDEYGNRSEEATVKLVVSKPYNDVFFTDMADHWAHADAITLLKNDIIDLTLSNKELPVFLPDKQVTRGEFLVMAMKATELDRGLKDVDFTGYDDDDMIPYYMKKYISAAKKTGIVRGIETEEGIIFSCDSPITRAEAAVILNRILDIPSTGSIEVFADGKSIPTWAETAMGNLVACGIMSGTGNGILDPEGILTNAQCASLLNKMMDWKDEN
ncbi:MAG: hypothetical protein E7665_06800 [Ruminococcaceae bacterium]|nr:hypothetical protein [Oscillospiraceae bacterium]